VEVVTKCLPEGAVCHLIKRSADLEEACKAPALRIQLSSILQESYVQVHFLFKRIKFIYSQTLVNLVNSSVISIALPDNDKQHLLNNKVTQYYKKRKLLFLFERPENSCLLVFDVKQTELPWQRTFRLNTAMPFMATLFTDEISVCFSLINALTARAFVFYSHSKV